MSYRKDSMPEEERIQRLEEAVARFGFRRWFESWRIGFVVLLAGLGIAAGGFGVSALVNQVSAYGRALATQSIERRESVRQECVDACYHAEMQVGRALLAGNDDTLHVAQCSCVSASGRRLLWNDLDRTPADAFCQLNDHTLTCEMDEMPARIRVVDHNQNDHLDVRTTEVSMTPFQ